jgi:FkbM family methyltransferase
MLGSKAATSGQAWAARYAALGENFRDKATLWLFGFLARSNTRPASLLRRWFGSPKKRLMRVRPGRLAGRAIWASPFDLGHRIIFEEFFVEGAYPLEKVPFTPDQILDCGAHIGLFSVLALQKFPRASLIAFEPSPDNYAILARQFSEDRTAPHLRRAAVSHAAGFARFSSHSSCDGRLVRSDDREKSYEVQVLDLPALVKQAAPLRLMLKVDIEGEEQHLFPKLVPVLPETCALFFETHFGNERWEQTRILLEAARFQVEQFNMRDNGCADGFALRLPKHGGSA